MKARTVGELRKALEKFDADLPVAIVVEENEFISNLTGWETHKFRKEVGVYDLETRIELAAAAEEDNFDDWPV